MKIIGSTGRRGYITDKFILEATETELYNLIGYYSRCNSDIKVDVGDEIKVSEMYHQLYDLMNNKITAEKIATELEAIASLLRVKDPVKRALEVSKPKKSTKGKKEEE
jgi:hypothetical protein